ncbi:flagellar basal-body rod protein FlgG [Sediminicurvatus halobius]|uniref:Flagellar basal-body rod protein FlgG n=1 Tax=Sediminicurvatus halobius TaxID=2182432 RepID=A0A2U2N012_9GAMM|nr:flagellar basal-body rod protein FlgG [Spiribacter halobius]PWG62309.1 flagellar basal-body rod protein FlgG [Spiribacter halobius]UEX79770.1 flagellar basal-body rod protein FlgG [Spiribacter halobius]
MNPALWVAKTGLDAQQTRMSVVSNNLANVNTTGFKKDTAKFEDLVYQTIRQPGGQSTQDTQLPSGLMLGTGVRVAGTEKNHTQGNLQQTGNSLDVAINGRGFMQVLRPDGTAAYTRDGSLQLDNQGQIVTKNGYPIEPNLVIPQDTESITIGADGTVSAQVAGQAQPVQVGNIQLADFINPAGLQPIGDNLYTETAASGAPQQDAPGVNGLGSLQQGALESSNVNIAEELVNMIETQRGFETNTRAISATDQMLQFITQNV